MADISAEFTLATPGGTITFNAPTGDTYFIDSISGLDQAPIRAPIDDMPFGHGGIWHNFWEGPRHILFEGRLKIVSAWSNQLDILAARNSMEETLIEALRSIGALVTDVGTLTWTPYNITPARVLDVRCDVAVDFSEEENWLTKHFHFGLVAVNPDWDGWSS